MQPGSFGGAEIGSTPSAGTGSPLHWGHIAIFPQLPAAAAPLGFFMLTHLQHNWNWGALNGLCCATAIVTKEEGSLYELYSPHHVRCRVKNGPKLRRRQLLDKLHSPNIRVLAPAHHIYPAVGAHLHLTL